MILLPKSLFRFQNFPTCMLYDVRRVEFDLLIARNERLFPLEEECEYEEYE